MVTPMPACRLPSYVDMTPAKHKLPSLPAIMHAHYMLVPGRSKQEPHSNDKDNINSISELLHHHRAELLQQRWQRN